MATWRDVVDTEPDFAKRVQRIMDAYRHKTLATLRADGAPRISGIEASFIDGELWFGSMPGARKGRDLLRDPRFALHSGSIAPARGDESQWPGDAKISGRAVPLIDPDQVAAILRAIEGPADQPADLFRADIAEVVITRVGDPPDHLVIELWRPGAPLRRTTRT
ncbi:MAG TPA: pyridoxamine 5'-phosphate oxidase family protein [Pseudonocardiaceae bacterium]